jgi:hypothetical protein
VITLRVKILTGIESVLGLMGNKKPGSVFFNTRFGIHTFGVRFPIDILILDKDNKVVSSIYNQLIRAWFEFS